VKARTAAGARKANHRFELILSFPDRAPRTTRT
jgi:hypothetical protein